MGLSGRRDKPEEAEETDPDKEDLQPNSKVQKCEAESEGCGALSAQPSVGFDTETTGFKCDGGSEELIAIGLCRSDGQSFERYFLPVGYFSDQASQITGLDSG
jgi:DNA polymerase III epsilon subunit-like protein